MSCFHFKDSQRSGERGSPVCTPKMGYEAAIFIVLFRHLWYMLWIFHDSVRKDYASIAEIWVKLMVVF